MYEAAWAAGRGVPRLLAALTGRYQLRVNTGRSETGYRWVKGVSDSHLFPFLIIRIYMTSSSGLTIAINHASHFSNGQWLLLTGDAQYDGGDSTECTVCSGEGARGKIPLQCTTLLSGGRGKNNTAYLFSGLFFSPDDHCINLLQSNSM